MTANELRNKLRNLADIAMKIADETIDEAEKPMMVPKEDVSWEEWQASYFNMSFLYKLEEERRRKTEPFKVRKKSDKYILINKEETSRYAAAAMLGRLSMGVPIDPQDE
jgi:hypothetical protein